MAVNPGYTRRQELHCTLAELATYGAVILYEGEALYVLQKDGTYDVKIGDGVTPISALPYVVNYSDIKKMKEAAENAQSLAEAARTGAEQAKADAESILAETTANIAANTLKITQNTQAISQHNKRLTNIEQGIPTDEFLTDNTVAYQKDVPANALPYAKISKIGGMTRKCTNLIPFPYYEDSKTVNGVTITVGEKGGITLNGTATANSGFAFIRYANIKVNGIFTLSSATSGSVSGNTYLQPYIDETPRGSVSLNDSKSYTFEGNLNQLSMFCDIGTVFTNFVVYPMFNEGENALPYEPYFEGFRSAPVTAVKSVGVNLIPFPYYEDSKTVNGVTITVGEKGGITLNGTATANSAFTFIRYANIKVNGIFTLSSATSGSVSGNAYLQPYIDETPRGTVSFNDSKSYTFEGNLNQLSMFWDIGTVFTNFVVYPMFNEGENALPYTPYIHHNIPIYAEVQALDGYGLGVDATYNNYVTWENDMKTSYTKMAKKVVFDGTENWGKYANSDSFIGSTYPGYTRWDVKLDTYPAGLQDDLLCNKYVNNGANIPGVWINDTAKTLEFRIVTNEFETVDELKTALAKWYSDGDPLTVVYAVKTPEITDISDILTADNLIQVEGGGTLTFENEYGYDVPSEITYQLDQEEVTAE